ncbi:hypothetical protein CGSHiHH_05556 [Haemophilus influenzae PittHH]|nr:hypothetical protein CGSHiHH_05556 [Haemophilus influenzae PittHH]
MNLPVVNNQGFGKVDDYLGEFTVLRE